MFAKNNVASNTPTKTPMARLCVATTTITVEIITTFDERGFFFKSLTDAHENVPIDTIIITATNAAIGINRSHSSKNTTMMIKNEPAIKVESRAATARFNVDD